MNFRDVEGVPREKMLSGLKKVAFPSRNSLDACADAPYPECGAGE